MADKIDPLTKDLDSLREQARSARRLLEPGWFLDLAFFQGKQWVVWAGDRLHRPELGSNRITVTENRIAGVVRTELSKMTKNRPVFTVTPNTGGEEDANAAEMSERLMRYMWRHLKMHDLSLKALEWSRICGSGFLKCYWDPTVGDKVEVLIGPDGQVIGKQSDEAAVRAAQVLSQTGLQVSSKKIAQGDVRVETRSPFQMFVDPICDTFEEVEWLIEESIRSPDYVQQRFDKKLKPDAPANPGLVEQRMTGSTPGGGGSFKGVRIREYWAKPCAKYPAGVRIVWAQGQILDRDDKPFDPMPYVMFTGIPVPGRLWPMSTVEFLRGPQTELNKVLSQMAENRNRVGNPTVLASKQATLDPEKFLDSLSAPGGTYFFDETGSQHPVPQYLEAPTLPDYVQEEPVRIVKAIEDISGQHEVTNANVPPGVTAASAITLLQEADDTRLGLAMQDYEEQLGRFGRKVLELVANFYNSARTIKISGEDGAWEIFDFKGTMLRGNTHVDVQAGSAFPQSQAAKQAQMTDYLRMIAQMGIQPTQRQLQQYLRDQGMGASDRLVAEYTTSENQANSENARMAQGQVLNINPYDDDEAHVANHEDFERQPRFKQLPEQVQQAIMLHVAAHQERLAQQQQAQMEMQMQMEAGPQGQQQQMNLLDQGNQSQIQGAAQSGQQLEQGAQEHAQKQGFSQAQAEQQQRHTEEQHHARMSQMQEERQRAAELHQQKLHQADEQHRARMTAQQQQAKQQRQQGAQSGRRNAA